MWLVLSLVAVFGVTKLVLLVGKKAPWLPIVVGSAALCVAYLAFDLAYQLITADMRGYTGVPPGPWAIGILGAAAGAIALLVGVVLLASASARSLRALTPLALLPTLVAIWYMHRDFLQEREQQSRDYANWVWREQANVQFREDCWRTPSEAFKAICEKSLQPEGPDHARERGKRWAAEHKVSDASSCRTSPGESADSNVRPQFAAEFVAGCAEAIPGLERSRGQSWANDHNIQDNSDCAQSTERTAFSAEFIAGCAAAVASRRAWQEPWDQEKGREWARASYVYNAEDCERHGHETDQPAAFVTGCKLEISMKTPADASAEGARWATEKRIATERECHGRVTGAPPEFVQACADFLVHLRKQGKDWARLYMRGRSECSDPSLAHYSGFVDHPSFLKGCQDAVEVMKFETGIAWAQQYFVRDPRACVSQDVRNKDPNFVRGCRQGAVDTADDDRLGAKFAAQKFVMRTEDCQKAVQGASTKFEAGCIRYVRGCSTNPFTPSCREFSRSNDNGQASSDAARQ
jgi:hypothetical protein